MKAIPITPEHFLLTLEWLRKNKAYLPSAAEMPVIGYIAYEAELPIAAGYLRWMEGGMAMIDGLCTNPDMPPALRNRALNCIVDQLLETAKESNISRVIAFTVDEKVLMRALRYRFEQLPHTLIALDLLNRRNE